MFTISPSRTEQTSCIIRAPGSISTISTPFPPVASPRRSRLPQGLPDPWPRTWLASTGNDPLLATIPPASGQGTSCAPGGKKTGQKVSHYIAEGGPFAAACAELAGQGVAVSYVDLWGEGDEKTRRTKAASKTKYTCPSCGLNAWAKPAVVLVCGECEIALTEAFTASADETPPAAVRRPGRGPQPQ